MQELEKARPERRFCVEVLDTDSDIRFVGILCKCGRLKAYHRKKGMIPQLNVQETKLLHREALLKAKMNHVFDKRLGRTNWSIESRDNVKWITVNHGKDLILLSTENSSDHDRIIRDTISRLQIPY